MPRPALLPSPTTFRLSTLAAVAFAALLAACGGGGGGGGDDPVGVATPATEAVESGEPGDAAFDAARVASESAQAAAPYRVALSADQALITQGKSVAITVTVERKAGFGGAVNVRLRGLPEGVSARAVTVPEGENEARVVLRAAATAPHSLPTLASVRVVADDSLASAPLVVTVRGLPGSVDTSFGGGPVVTPVGESEDYAAAVAVQRNGRVLVAGSSMRPGGGTDFAVVRYLRDGAPDKQFGDKGRVSTSVAPETRSDQGVAVAVQADGRIVVAGNADMGATREDFALVRYLPDGRLDPDFGKKGKVTTAFSGDSSDRIQSIAIQPDGKIVVGGFTYSGAETNIDFALARYNPDGRLDTTFGHGGKVVTAVVNGAGHDSINAITLQKIDGEVCIVAVGGEGDFLIARYRADGTLDKRFGNKGIVTELFPSAGIGAARAVAALPGGKLAVTGHIQHDVTTVQLRSDGTLDAGFGEGGRVVTAVAKDNWDEATSIVRQADGKLVVGGWVYKGSSSAAQFVALRYTKAGTLDTRFGNAGISMPSVSQEFRSASGRAMVLQADKRIPTVRALQAGDRSQSNYDFALLRYWL